MVSAYRTLAETGRLLGVSAQRVRELIEHGPLNGVERPEGLAVHDEDLRAFRRPLPASAFPGYSALCKLGSEEGSADSPVPASLQDDPDRQQPVAPRTPAARHLRVVPR